MIFSPEGVVSSQDYEYLLKSCLQNGAKLEPFIMTYPNVKVLDMEGEA